MRPYATEASRVANDLARSGVAIMDDPAHDRDFLDVSVAGGVLRTSTRPTLNLPLLLLNASV